MSTIINGTSNAITFPDSTVQNTSAVVGGKVPTSLMPSGTVVQVQNGFSSSIVAIANSGSGRIYADLITFSYTPLSASNKLILLGTSGFSSCVSLSSKGAFGITFNLNGTNLDFSNYPWYNATGTLYPSYPPDTSLTRTIAMPTGSTFTAKLLGFSYNESSGTMTPQFLNYSLTLIEVAA